MGLTYWESQTTDKVTITLPFQVIGLPEQCVWQFK